MNEQMIQGTDTGVANKLRVFYRDRLDELESLLHRITESSTREDLHKLRVIIKKVKAFLKFVAQSRPEFDNKEFGKPFKALFKKAGKVREIQLEISALKKMETFDKIPGYEKWLEKKLKQSIKAFFRLNVKNLHTVLEENYKNILPFLSGIGLAEAERFLHKQAAMINEHLDKHKLNQAEAHSLRKKLKEYHYITKLLSQKNDFTEQIDQFQTLLGNWHDEVVLNNQLLRAVSNKHFAGNEESTLGKIEKKVKKKANKHLKKINHQFSGLHIRQDVES